MLTTVEQRAEARRLVDLDARGRLIESVALALRIGEDQEAAMSELVRMDRDMVEWINAGLGEVDLRIGGEG
jgi:hypothetical protein